MVWECQEAAALRGYLGALYFVRFDFFIQGKIGHFIFLSKV